MFVVHSEGELTVLEVEHLVHILLALVEQVEPGTNIGGVWAFSDKLEAERVAIGLHPIGSFVLLVGTLNLAVFTAGLGIRAQICIPLIPGVAICGLAFDVRDRKSVV